MGTTSNTAYGGGPAVGALGPKTAPSRTSSGQSKREEYASATRWILVSSVTLTASPSRTRSRAGRTWLLVAIAHRGSAARFFPLTRGVASDEVEGVPKPQAQDQPDMGSAIGPHRGQPVGPIALRRLESLSGLRPLCRDSSTSGFSSRGVRTDIAPPFYLGGNPVIQKPPLGCQAGCEASTETMAGRRPRAEL